VSLKRISWMGMESHYSARGAPRIPVVGSGASQLVLVVTLTQKAALITPHEIGVEGREDRSDARTFKSLRRAIKSMEAQPGSSTPASPRTSEDRQAYPSES
jgi:hypothetical protein